ECCESCIILRLILDNVFFKKCTHIEIHLLTPSGFQGETQDLLFIAIERYKFCVLKWDADANEVIIRFDP
nr:DNA damage-binding protein 1 [Tanacetum cinerariifolium]